ncbi:MAG: beta-1,6-glucan synthase [Betaproteobacteria bacterium HGW-Betaproteobacteria-8]|nr:MAG: beta-1,6-glucan synthase [Betaproteobacteria bacterium HGW-Betaproteobacteria-8]
MPRQKLWLFSCLNLILLLSLSFWLWSQNQPVELAKPALPENQKLQCASYAPYYTKGQSPFIKGTVISPEQIEHDLALLADRFDCVRTYSVGQGLHHVPETASKLGMEVILGVWIGWTDAENNRELTLGLKLANQYPEVIRAVVVGNEVLLRKEQTPAKLRAYLKRAKDSTSVPITYADVWEYWIKYQSMEGSVDFVTAHVLPYWEDDPQSIEAAILHASNVMKVLDATFSKPILIGETGWPSEGRHRNASAPSLVNQARYIREFLQVAQEKQWNYNLIEAFDQPWKRVLEGTVGGHWGLYDSQLNAKFSLTEAVAERNDGWHLYLSAALGVLVFSLLALFRQSTGASKSANLFAVIPLGAIAGAIAYLQLGYLVLACRDIYEWLALGGLAVAGWVGVLALPAFLLSGSSRARTWMHASLWLLAIAALTGSLLLLLDGRYRDFPISLFVLPCLQFGLVLLAAGFSIGRLPKRYVQILATSILANIALLFIEPLNLQAWAWLALNLLLLAAGFHKNHSSSTPNQHP